MIRLPDEFDDFFHLATGHRPYEYQRRLGATASPPGILGIPTGAGKTQALIVSWLYARLVLGIGPRRLVYALPMRTLVEQTRNVAQEILASLELDKDDCSLVTLMGGSDPLELREWQEAPERNQILIGTIDMLLSRALNRGYAASRFAWPIAFGLLNNDCRWVFDEVQLMGPARSTSAQLHGLRDSLGTMLPCETVWASATVDESALCTIDHPAPGTVLSLSESDRSSPPLKKRLLATKLLQRLDLGEQTGGDLPRAIAQAAADRHVEASRTLIVLNTVELAQATYRALAPLTGAKTVLLHSRFRPEDRNTQMESALANPPTEGTIVVATQVIEAGVDASARLLLSETAPMSSMVQRAGRCNREGEYDEASVIWLDRGPLATGLPGRKAAAPYEPQDVEQARSVLLELEGTSISPSALERVVERPDVHETADDPEILRRSDLLDLFDTSPDLSGLDIDIAPFIRPDDDRGVTVIFRDLPTNAEVHLKEEPAPRREEMVQVPRFGLGKRDTWIVDTIDGGWTRRMGNAVPPAGATVLLRSSDGGYDPRIGWDPKIKRAVEPLPPEEPEPPEGIAEDPLTEMKSAEELSPHLERVAAEAERLAHELDLKNWQEVLRNAGALHDLGKAHPVFQETLRTAMKDQLASDDTRVWAKSNRRSGPGHARKYFRHELASALAVRQMNGSLNLSHPALTVYLIAAHHGKVRLSIRPAADESPPDDVAPETRFALGIIDGDVLPVVGTPLGETTSVKLDLAPMEFGSEDSWSETVSALRDDPALGPFRLGFLEALLRIADWRGSDG